MLYDFITGLRNLEPNYAATGGVEFVRRELLVFRDQYSLIDDCIAGEQRVKERRTTYLQLPGNMNDADHLARYNNYVSRAVFYGVAGRTLDGLVGRVFTRDAVAEVPTSLTPVLDDANGESVSFDQLTQKGVATVVAKGRAGLFVDYPRVESASRQQLNTGEIKPTIHLYQPQQITNWRKVRINGKDKLTLVVLMEQYTIEDDGFASKQAIQYRVLRLTGGIYTVELWRQTAGEARGFVLYENPTVPLNFQGKPYDELPFRFLGPRESSSDIEKPPMYDLCSLNIAHYRNSADYEESCFVTGQPTLWAAGLTQTWVKEVLGGKIGLGSRGIIMLPKDGTAGLLQTEPNSMPFEAMEHKEKQMVALGAKLVEQKSVQRTATEAGIDENAETSVLSSCARNVSKGMQWALQWCGYFVGAEEASIKYELNTDFDLNELDSAERAQLVKEWQAEAITYGEMRDALRKAGVATLTDEEAQAALTKERTFFAPEVDPNDPNGGSDSGFGAGA